MSSGSSHDLVLSSSVMATYLVTGGAGFIGSSLAQALLKAGDRVRIVDDFSTGRRQNLEDLGGKVELFEGSICDAALMTKASTGVDAIFHQAAMPSVIRSVETPQASMQVNVQGTTTVLDVARTVGVKRVVFAASSSAYGNTKELPKHEGMVPSPLSPYAIAKHTGEQLMRVFHALYGIETVSLRYFNVFGPRQDPKSHYAAVIPNFMTAAITHAQPRVFGDGEQTRDFCFIDNTVAANMLAATSSKKLSGEVINIACGDRISLNQLLSMISEEANFKLEATYEPNRAGDVRDSLADISAAQALIGYEPKVRVREGIRRTFEAFKKTHA
jgi:nucleoside-diphosphate-sugar epimerase